VAATWLSVTGTTALRSPRAGVSGPRKAIHVSGDLGNEIKFTEQVPSNNESMQR
jgi:hypothetical protein